MDQGDKQRIVDEVFRFVEPKFRDEDLLQHLWLSILEAEEKAPDHKDHPDYLFCCVRNGMIDFFREKRRWDSKMVTDQDLDAFDGSGRYWKPEDCVYIQYQIPIHNNLNVLTVRAMVRPMANSNRRVRVSIGLKVTLWLGAYGDSNDRG